ncbi:hypothetical protein RND81_12G009000 [Saponaria officinalis]|uniref:Uncharacterized protein n=1 Tax=Saponaria officinalis TaxID=3572 RepID=A0AAW1H6Z8_SAPOF
MTELESFARSNNRPWMLAGDFNETRSINERHGGDQNMARRCDRFNNWIENCELIELAITGSLHTWARGNSVETRQSARLDRALCNANWGTMFEEAMVKHLPAIASDHCPLLISPNGFAPLNSINRPFRFQACWMTHENFKEFVDTSWPSNGIFPTRHEELSRRLKEWNDHTFGNIFRQKRNLIARISGCQRELSKARLKHLIKLEAKLRKELEEILAREELLWYQKSHMEFITDGDRNTSYFHEDDDLEAFPEGLIDTSRLFNTNLIFQSRLHLISEVRKMGKPHNIVIRLRTHHPKRRHGIQWLMCDRSIKYYNRTKLDGTSSDQPFTGSKKCRCPFSLKGVGQADGTWTLEVRNGFHNHAIRSKDTILDQETKETILSMTASKISVSNILIELGNRKIDVAAKQVYNIRAREISASWKRVSITSSLHALET